MATSRSVLLRVFAVLFAATIAVPSTLGFRADAWLVDPSMLLGQSTTLRIDLVEPPEDARLRFDVPADAGYTLEFVTSSRSYSSKTRRVRGQIIVDEASLVVSHLYVLTPTRSGVFEVPPIQVTNGAGDLLGVETEPIGFRVAAPTKRPDVRVEAAFDRDSVWAGETVTLTITLQRPTGSSFDKPPTLMPGGLPAVFSAQRSQPVRGRIRFMGGNLEEEAERIEIAGVSYDRFTFRRELRARVEGRHVIDPVVLAADFIARGFNRPVTVSVPSDPIIIEIKALPNGAPDGFGGLVGTFSVQASADDTELRVGDPFVLTVLVRGTGRIANIAAPDVAGMLGDTFRVRPGEEVIRGDSAMFTFTVRALDPTSDTIPPIRLPYFDPIVGAYATAQSLPIRLEVTGTSITRVLGETGSIGTASGSGTPTLRDAFTDLSANVRGGRLLERGRFDIRDAAASPVIIMLVVAPPAAYGLAALGLFVVRKRDSSAGVTIKAAASVALRSLDEHAAGGDEYRIARALCRYAARRKGGDERVLTPADGAAQITADNPHLAEPARRLARLADAGRYGGESLQGALGDTRGLFDQLRSRPSGVAGSR